MIGPDDRRTVQQLISPFLVTLPSPTGPVVADVRGVEQLNVDHDTRAIFRWFGVV